MTTFIPVILGAWRVEKNHERELNFVMVRKGLGHGNAMPLHLGLCPYIWGYALTSRARLWLNFIVPSGEAGRDWANCCRIFTSSLLSSSNLKIPYVRAYYSSAIDG